MSRGRWGQDPHTLDKLMDDSKAELLFPGVRPVYEGFFVFFEAHCDEPERGLDFSTSRLGIDRAPTLRTEAMMCNRRGTEYGTCLRPIPFTCMAGFHLQLSVGASACTAEKIISSLSYSLRGLCVDTLSRHTALLFRAGEEVSFNVLGTSGDAVTAIATEGRGLIVSSRERAEFSSQRNASSSQVASDPKGSL